MAGINSSGIQPVECLDAPLQSIAVSVDSGKYQPVGSSATQKGITADQTSAGLMEVAATVQRVSRSVDNQPIVKIRNIGPVGQWFEPGIECGLTSGLVCFSVAGSIGVPQAP